MRPARPSFGSIAATLPGRKGLFHNCRGLLVLVTGRPQAGKTTLATTVARVLPLHGVVAAVLDGEQQRQCMGNWDMSWDARRTHLVRMGRSAAMEARMGRVALLSSVAPSDEARRAVLAMVPSMCVYLSASAEDCRARDSKGLYAMSDAGLLDGLTGVDSRYEEPVCPDLAIGADVQPIPAAIMLLEAVLARIGAQSDAERPE